MPKAALVAPQFFCRCAEGFLEHPPLTTNTQGPIGSQRSQAVGAFSLRAFILTSCLDTADHDPHDNSATDTDHHKGAQDDLRAKIGPRKRD
jgi:hypothetical protein